MGLPNDFPMGHTKKEFKAARQSLVAQGVPQAQRKAFIQGIKNNDRTQQQGYLSNLLQNPEAAGVIRHPQKFLKNALKGKGPATSKLLYLDTVDKMRHTKDVADLQKQHAEDVANSLKPGADILPNQHEGERGVYDAQGDMMKQWIDPTTGTVRGLDPAYEADLRRRGAEMIAGQRQNEERQNADQMSQAGIDPRSGVAREAQQGTDATTLQAGLGLNSSIADLNESARRAREGEIANRAALEESARHGMTSEDLTRTGQAEGDLSGAADAEAGNRMFDLTYAEAQRQNDIRNQQLNRLIDEAGKDRGPSTFEKVAGGLNSFRGGLMGGGGGGGGI